MAVATEAERARAFARSYVNLVEALMREGVTEETARNEARMVATTELHMQDIDPRTYDPARGPCPTCGRG